MAGRDALKFKVIMPPVGEPVTLSDIKAQLQIDVSDTIYDDQINALIPAAREWCEQYQNRAYLTQTIELAQDHWPCNDEIRLPRPPLQSVSTLAYTTVGGTASTVSTSEYLVDTFSEPGYLVAKECWPTDCLQAANAVRVIYVTGYGTASSDVPVTIRQAIILLVAHWFNNGLCDPPNAVLALLNLERVIPV